MYNPPLRPRSGRLAPKLIRLVEEVQSCPGGIHEAFHLYIFVKAHIFPQWDPDSFGPIGNNPENKRVDSQILKIIKGSLYDQPGKLKERPTIFFNFAAAKREIWNSIPAECNSCDRQQTQGDPSDPLWVPPLPAYSCRRASNLRLIEQLQVKAYGEIRFSVMLTLGRKLPKEICILIFEFVSLTVDCPCLWAFDTFLRIQILCRRCRGLLGKKLCPCIETQT